MVAVTIERDIGEVLLQARSLTASSSVMPIRDMPEIYYGLTFIPIFVQWYLNVTIMHCVTI